MRDKDGNRERRRRRADAQIESRVEPGQRLARFDRGEPRLKHSVKVGRRRDARRRGEQIAQRRALAGKAATFAASICVPHDVDVELLDIFSLVYPPLDFATDFHNSTPERVTLKCTRSIFPSAGEAFPFTKP